MIGTFIELLDDVWDLYLGDFLIVSMYVGDQAVW